MRCSVFSRSFLGYRISRKQEENSSSFYSFSRLDSNTVQLLLLLLISPALILQVAAQNTSTPAPRSVTKANFAVVGSNLYVQSGSFMASATSNRINITAQFYALDLSVSWPVSKPPWKVLPNGPSNGMRMGFGMPDNRTFMVMASTETSVQIHRFSQLDRLNTAQWSMIQTRATDPILEGDPAVIDPTTGLVYVLESGYMNIFNPSNNNWKKNKIDYMFAAPLTDTGAFYFHARRSIVYFGGSNFVNNGTIVEYFIETNLFLENESNGDNPRVRSNHCMASNADGSKVIMYGGRIPNPSVSSSRDPVTSELFIFNAVTNIWKKGPNGVIARADLVCAVVGNMFIAWGGSDTNGMSVSGTPAIFDLDKSLWVDSYSPPPGLLPTKPSSTNLPSATDPSKNSPDNNSPTINGSGSNIGAIVGGAVGGVVAVVALMVGLWLLRRKRRLNQEYYAMDQQSIDRLTAQGTKSMDPKENFRPNSKDSLMRRSPEDAYERDAKFTPDSVVDKNNGYNFSRNSNHHHQYTYSDDNDKPTNGSNNNNRGPHALMRTSQIIITHTPRNPQETVSNRPNPQQHPAYRDPQHISGV